MKKITLIAFVASSLFLGQAYAVDLDLEPCINGDVSSSGAFASERLEQIANSKAVEAYEPCIDGDV